MEPIIEGKKHLMEDVGGRDRAPNPNEEKLITLSKNYWKKMSHTPSIKPEDCFHLFHIQLLLTLHYLADQLWKVSFS